MVAMTVPDVDLYTFLFEHFPPTRVIRHDAPLLLHALSASPSTSSPSSLSCRISASSQYGGLSLLELRQRVDDMSMGLWSDARLKLREVLGTARRVAAASRRMEDAMPRALILLDKQAQGSDRLDSIIALLACSRLGMTVCVVESESDSISISDLDLDKLSLARRLDAVRPLLAFAPPRFVAGLCESGLSPKHVVLMGREEPLSSSISSQCATLTDIEVRRRGPSSWSELDQCRLSLQGQEVYHWTAMLVLREDSNSAVQVMRASHAQVIAGILSTEHLLLLHRHALLGEGTSSVGGSSVVRGGPTGNEITMVQMPLDDAAGLTLSYLLPIWQGRSVLIAGPGEDLHGLPVDALFTDGLTAATKVIKRPIQESLRCLVIVQPGAGQNVQNALMALKPGLSLLNGYAPKESTGLTHLTRVARSETLLMPGYVVLGLASYSPSPTLVAPGSKGGRTIVMSGPTMMTMSHPQPSQAPGYTEVGDMATLDYKGCLHILSSTSCSTSDFAEAQDLLTSHPRVQACALVEPPLPQDGAAAAAVAKLKPVAFVVPVTTTSHPQGTGAKTLANEVTKWISEHSRAFKASKAHVIVVESLPRHLTSLKGRMTALEAALVPKGKAAAQVAKTSGRLSAAKAASVATSYATTVAASASGPTAPAPTKKPGRDSKRRATHSQIERRRREKINDRLVTLRVIVPACAAEVEERKRQRREEEEEWRRIAAGEISARAASLVGGARGKRKRNRKKATSASDGPKEEELGLHKLEVLTHAIDYIYELQARIEELETGHRPARIKRAEDKDVDQDQEPVEEEEVDEEGDADEDEGSGSDGGLEMAEWQGIRTKVEEGKEHQNRPTLRRKVVGAVRADVHGQNDLHRRRSAASSGSSEDMRTSPAVMSLSAESPMFSGACSSSASAYTSLTSPMMSLSAESPILRSNAHPGKSDLPTSPERRNSSVALHHMNISSAASSSSPLTSSSTSPAATSALSANNAGTSTSTRASSITKSPSHWQMLPAPALAFSGGAPPSSSRPSSARSTQAQEALKLLATPASSLTPITTDVATMKEMGKPQQRDAELLLSFSTSPEVLRPMSSVRKTFKNSSTSPSLARRLTASSISGTAQFDSSALWPRRIPLGDGNASMPLATGEKVGARSAPGGAHASSSSSMLLASPPLLALDGPSVQSRKKPEEADDIEMMDGFEGSQT